MSRTGSFGSSTYAPAEEQHADGLTKPFGPKAMKRFQQQMLGTQLHGVMAKKAEVRKVWWNPFGEAKSGKKHRVAFAAGTSQGGMKRMQTAEPIDEFWGSEDA